MAKQANWAQTQPTNPNEHRHTYRNDEGEERSLVCNEHHVSLEEAAARLDDIDDAEQWSWILTEGHSLGGGVAPTAIPCAECGGQIWMSRQSAERNRGKGTARCGACVRAEVE